VILFGKDPEIAAITEHRDQGGRAVFIRYGRLVMATGRDEVTLVEARPFHAIPGRHSFQVENVLAAVGRSLGHFGLSLGN